MTARARIGRVLFAGPGGLPWIVVAALIGLGIAIIGTPNPTGDSGALIEGSIAIHGCLSDPSTWGHCNGIPYAPLQYIPGIIMVEFGSSSGQMMAALSTLSTLAFVGVLLMAWRLMRSRGLDMAASALLLVLSGPLIHYAASAFGEMLAAFAFVAVVYSVARRAPMPAVIGATWLAGISKDTAVPFVILIVAAVLLGGLSRPRWRDVKKPVIAAAIGTGLALGTVTGLNLIRWGTLSNEAYNWDPFQAPLGQVPKSAAGLIASPNGGLAIFWPAAAALVLACVPLIIWGLRRTKGSRLWATLPAALILAGAVAQVLVLGAWWAPFGWAAWGPRLALPVFAGLALAVLCCYWQQIHNVLVWCRRTIWPLLLAIGILVFTTLSNVGSLVRPLIANFQTPEEICPLVGFSAETAAGYYRCLNWTMWNYDPRILVGIEQLSLSTGILVLGIVSAAAVTTLALLASRTDEVLR